MTMTTATNTLNQTRKISLGRCKVCHGNLAIEIDEDTGKPYLFCIQCGRPDTPEVTNGKK